MHNEFLVCVYGIFCFLVTKLIINSHNTTYSFFSPHHVSFLVGNNLIEIRLISVFGPSEVVGSSGGAGELVTLEQKQDSDKRASE